MKLKLESIKQAVSFPAAVDVVFYKDDEGRLYRLRYIEDNRPRNTAESLHRIMLLGEHAPKEIVGRVIFENKGELRISGGREIYHIQKNAQNFRFFECKTR